jgi:GNAT superfamily N-acetyltransferase
LSVRFPEGWRIEPLGKHHKREAFDCSEPQVNGWLRTKARQSQDKHLSATKVLVNDAGNIAAFYTLAYGQVHLDQLPRDIARKLPKQLLPVVILAWLGVDSRFRGRGLGDRMLAQALHNCLLSSQHIPFVAVIVDCIHAQSKAFFARYGFGEFPGQPLKLLVPRKLLEALGGFTNA